MGIARALGSRLAGLPALLHRGMALFNVFPRIAAVDIPAETHTQSNRPRGSWWRRGRRRQRGRRRRRRRRRRRGRRRRRQGRRRRRGEHADALTERGARASHVGVYSGEFKTATSETVGSDVAAWRIQGWVACVIVGKRARVELAKRRGGGIALVLDIDDPPTAGAALDHVEASGDLGLVVLPGRHGWRGWRLRRRRRRRRGRQ